MKKEYEFLKEQMLKACFSKYPIASNRKRIEKLASQMRHFEKTYLKGDDK